MDYSTILVEKKTGFATITLNRPDKLNALNGQVFADLEHALRKLQDDNDAYVLILTGSGTKAFAAGSDIGELH